MTPTQKLEKIRKIYDTKTPIKGYPASIMSTHARDNLMGAYYDMKKTGKADKICLDTILRVMKQLARIEKVLSI